jgi:hypothetical protein
MNFFSVDVNTWQGQGVANIEIMLYRCPIVGGEGFPAHGWLPILAKPVVKDKIIE